MKLQFRKGFWESKNYDKWRKLFYKSWVFIFYVFTYLTLVSFVKQSVLAGLLTFPIMLFSFAIMYTYWRFDDEKWVRDIQRKK